jgi:ribosomal protein L11 methyltransferase
LAIAALLLGAEDCLAVDLDPQAICATEDNALLNGVSDRLNAILPAQFESKAYDVVLANILAEPIIGMAQQLTECLAPEGILVLSGIMTSQQEMVEAHFRDDLQFIDQFEREGWLCLVVRRC